jgi:TPR repeat protein
MPQRNRTSPAKHANKNTYRGSQIKEPKRKSRDEKKIEASTPPPITPVSHLTNTPSISSEKKSVVPTRLSLPSPLQKTDVIGDNESIWGDNSVWRTDYYPNAATKEADEKRTRLVNFYKQLDELGTNQYVEEFNVRFNNPAFLEYANRRYPNLEKYWDLWLQAAQSTAYVSAVNNVGNERELHGKKEDAFFCYKLAAETNHPIALANMGFCYLNGMGVPVDHSEAVRYFLRATHADPAHYPEATYALANQGLAYCYENGIGGVPVNRVIARNLYMQSATYGNARAYYRLYEIDHNRAWLIAAANRGYAPALYKLGAGEPNCEGKFKKKALDQGYPPALYDRAIELLDNCSSQATQESVVTTEMKQEALAMLRRAARQGYKPANERWENYLASMKTADSLKDSKHAQQKTEDTKVPDANIHASMSADNAPPTLPTVVPPENATATNSHSSPAAPPVISSGNAVNVVISIPVSAAAAEEVSTSSATHNVSSESTATVATSASVSSETSATVSISASVSAAAVANISASPAPTIDIAGAAAPNVSSMNSTTYVATQLGMKTPPSIQSVPPTARVAKAAAQRSLFSRMCSFGDTGDSTRKETSTMGFCNIL